MKKYENFCSALTNMQEIYNYDEPYDTVILTGLVGLYEVCFEQAWKLIKAVLEMHGYEQSATGSPKTILKTAYEAGMIKDETLWLKALHELGARLYVALYAEAHHAALTVGQVLLCKCVILVVGKGCVLYPFNLGVIMKICCNLLCVGGMSLHSECKRIAAEVAYIGVHGRHDCTDIPYHLSPALCAECDWNVSVY